MFHSYGWQLTVLNESLHEKAELVRRMCLVSAVLSFWQKSAIPTCSPVMATGPVCCKSAIIACLQILYLGTDCTGLPLPHPLPGSPEVNLLPSPAGTGRGWQERVLEAGRECSWGRGGRIGMDPGGGL